MQYREIGKTGIEISEIGFGAWGIGGGWGPTEDEESRRALRHAFERGVNFYDTALGYGNGHSEELIGSTFRNEREKIVIASKIPPKNGRWPVKDSDPISETFPASWVIECTETSLKNLGSDYIDVMQLHAWTKAYMQQTEWLEAFQKLKQQGKIRAFGVSVNDWDPYSGVELARSGLVDSIQVIYNIFEQRPDEQLLPAAQEGKTGIFARVPFEEGLLTGAFHPDYKFPEGDWRGSWLTPERLAIAWPKVQALKAYLAPDRPTLAALALKFILSNPVVTSVIPGMRKVANLDANVAASDGELLPENVHQELQKHKWWHGWYYPWDKGSAS